MRTSIFILFLLPNFALAQFQGCGKYRFQGVLVLKESKSLEYLVHPGTMSQLTFEIDHNDLPTMAAYIDRPTSFEADILRLMDGTKGQIKNIKNISFYVPNPLAPEKEASLKFVSKQKCESSK